MKPALFLVAIPAVYALWPNSEAPFEPQKGGEIVGPSVLMNARDSETIQILDTRETGRKVPDAISLSSANSDAQTPIFLLGDAQKCRIEAQKRGWERFYIVAPSSIEFHNLPNVPQISPAVAAQKQAQKWPLFDISEEFEFQKRRIEGSKRLDYAAFQAQKWDELPRNRPFIVACRVGHRSQLVVQKLRKSGFDAHNLNGGLWEWESQNLPIELGQK